MMFRKLPKLKVIRNGSSLLIPETRQKETDMPSSLEKVSLSLSGTSAANSTFDFLADEFEEEARTRRKP